MWETAADPAPASPVSTLTDAQLTSAVAAARQMWTAALGAGDSRLAALADAQFNVGNLPDDRLGVTIGHQVTIDSNAAGYGWSLDLSGRPQSGRMDLVSVVAHEMGNVMGVAEYGHETASITSPTLRPGVRLQPYGWQQEEGGAASTAVPSRERPDIGWDGRAELAAWLGGRDGSGLASAWLGEFSLTTRAKSTLDAPSGFINWRSAEETLAKARPVVHWTDEVSSELAALSGATPAVEP